MNKKIIKALNEAGIQNFFITKGNNATNDVYVVFSHNSSPGCYADNKKTGFMYDILVNLYCKKNIETNKMLVINALNDVGIKGGFCQASYKEETGYYNTAITFKYFDRQAVLI